MLARTSNLPMTDPSKIILVSSNGRCGVHEYSKVIAGALEQVHPDVEHIAIEYKDHETLRNRLKSVETESARLIFEYTPEIFDTRQLLLQFVRLRRAGAKITLSVHEAGPGTIYRKDNLRNLGSTMRNPFNPRRLWSVGRKLLTRPIEQLLRKCALRIIGRLSEDILIHSKHTTPEVARVFGHSDRIQHIPHFIPNLGTIEDSGSPAAPSRFIVPGFINPAKQILEVIEALPEESELVIAGTLKSKAESSVVEYHKRVAQRVSDLQGQKKIRLVQEYDQLENELRKSTSAIFYYDYGSQSGMASLAIGVGLPCIFSNIPAFDEIQTAGLTADSVESLRNAMTQMNDPAVRNRFSESAALLREKFSPTECAKRYILKANR